MKAGDQPLKIEGYHCDPFVIDWDGDGDLDLLSGSSEGGVQWAENTRRDGQIATTVGRSGPLIGHGPPPAYGQILREEDIKGPLS